jgi:ribonuclease-3
MLLIMAILFGIVLIVPKNPENRYSTLEKAINYTFRDRSLLEEALTHRSCANEVAGRVSDNQRLEFFGDSILGFLISHSLFESFPDAREGELTRMRAALVDEQNLFKVAGRLDLGAFLVLGKGEEKSGGREKRSILADACEALIAAVFIDGGIRAARKIVRRLFGSADAAALPGGARDYKSELQELVQSRSVAAPKYELTAVEGPDHEKVYSVSVLIDGVPAGSGRGRSKKEAQQAAACAALAAIRP